MRKDCHNAMVFLVLLVIELLDAIVNLIVADVAIGVKDFES